MGKLKTTTTTNGHAAPTAVKMPEEYSRELNVLQAQANKLKADFDTSLREIQLRGSILTVRAALAVGMSLEQLDSMQLTINPDGHREWRPQPKEPV